MSPWLILALVVAVLEFLMLAYILGRWHGRKDRPGRTKTPPPPRGQ